MNKLMKENEKNFWKLTSILILFRRQENDILVSSEKRQPFFEHLETKSFSSKNKRLDSIIVQKIKIMRKFVVFPTFWSLVLYLLDDISIII